MFRDIAPHSGCPQRGDCRRLVAHGLAGLLLIGLAGCAPLPAAPAPAATSAATPAPVEPAPAVTAPRAPASGTPASASTSAPAGAAASSVIHLVRSGGIAGRTEEWTLYGDGRVEGANSVHASVASGQVATLLSDLDQVGFFSLGDTYAGDGQCRDCFTYEITVTRDGQSKTVRVVQGATGVPPQVGQALDKINQVLGAAR